MNYYHGTLLKNKESIAKNGLLPSNGKWKHAIWGDCEKVVCFAREGQCLSSIYGALLIQIAFELKMVREEADHCVIEKGFTFSHFEKHGLICIVKNAELKMASEGGDFSLGTETNDYYSMDVVSVNEFIEGDAIIDFFVNEKIIPSDCQKNHLACRPYEYNNVIWPGVFKFGKNSRKFITTDSPQ
jgi:hypothetical protein